MKRNFFSRLFTSFTFSAGRRSMDYLSQGEKKKLFSIYRRPKQLVQGVSCVPTSARRTCAKTPCKEKKDYGVFVSCSFCFSCEKGKTRDSIVSDVEERKALCGISLHFSQAAAFSRKASPTYSKEAGGVITPKTVRRRM